MNYSSTNFITIIREHDKICILEQMLNYDREMEHIVSEYIDLCTSRQCKIACFHKIKARTTNVISLSKIIQLASSIAFNTPIKFPIDEMSNINHICN